MPLRTEVEKLQKTFGLGGEQALRDGPQPPYQFQIFFAAQVGIKLRFFRNIAEAPAKADQVARISRPSKKMPPAVGSSNPVSIFTVVVLPEPLGPRYPKTSPGSIRKLTSSTAGMLLYRLVSPLTRALEKASE